MSETFSTAAMELHGLNGWLILVLLLLFAATVGFFVFFVYLLARAVYRGTHPQETLTTLNLRPEADRTHDRQDPFDGT